MDKMKQIGNFLRRDKRGKGADKNSRSEEEKSKSGSSDEVSSQSSVSKSNNSHSKSPTRCQHSCYTGGEEGRCTDCGMLRKACNCHHCRVCGVYLFTLHSRHHCRRCWRAVCPACSSNKMVNDLVTGAKSRTCTTCAVPCGLMFTLGVMDTYACAAHEASLADVTIGLDFRWGLYALSCVVEPEPRCCTNPSCSAPFSLAESCHKCKMPTTVTARHAMRSVSLQDLESKAKEPLTATEAAVKEHRSTLVRVMEVAGVDKAFEEYLPLGVDRFAFHGARDDSWTARKMVLSAVAADIANEYHGSPHISLAMSDVPFAKLLAVTRVEKTFTLLESPGNVCYVAFPHIYNRKRMSEMLSAELTKREIWSTADARVIGVLLESKQSESTLTLEEKVGECHIQRALLALVEDDPVLQDVMNTILEKVRQGIDVVLCGHSLGGSIATVIAAKLLLENTFATKDRLLCVTFGAPLVADAGLTDILQANSLTKKFQHFVYGSDMLPRFAFITSFMDSGAMPTGSETETGNPQINMVEVLDKIISWCALNLPSPSSPAMHFMKQIADKKRKTPKKAKAKEGKEGKDGRESVEEMSEVADAAVGQPDCVGTAGDIFATTREPFENNCATRTFVAVGPNGQAMEGTSPLMHGDRVRFASEENRKLQVFDPLGCYNFLWTAGDTYNFSDNPYEIIGVLSDSTNVRVQLADHLMSSYTKAMIEYLYSIA